MKHKSIDQNQPQKPPGLSLSAALVEANQKEIDFAPSQDEVARRAYFTYVNQGSAPGHDVQHWLEAEAHFLAERNRTRIHGFHNRT
jgi:hypothetical protein